MNSIQPLLAVYSAILLINLAVSGLLWWKTRNSLHRWMLLMWLGGLLDFGIFGLVAEAAPLSRALAFSLSFFAMAPTAALSGAIIGFPVPLRRLAVFWGLSVLAALILSGLGVGAYGYTAPLSTGAAMPCLLSTYQAWRRRRSERLTLVSGGLIFTGLLMSLHLLDAIYALHHQEWTAAGFTLALILLVMSSIFAPAAIVEVLAKDNTRLLVRAEYEAKFAHSARMAQLGKMAGGIAHELNTPLAIIQALVDRLVSSARDGTLDAEVMARLGGKVAVSVTRMAGIIRGLLLFSGDKVGPGLVEVPLSKLIGEVVGLCEERLKRSGIELRMGGLPAASVLCNESQTLQALLALIENSIYAVSGLPERWISVEGALGDEQVEISVTDSGRGIPPEVTEKMMQPFFTTKPIGTGTGLGLSIAKGIAESQGGRLAFDAESLHTRFVLSLRSGAGH